MKYFPLLPLLICLLFISCSGNDKEEFDLIISNATIINIDDGSRTGSRLILISGDNIVRVEDSSNKENYSAKKRVDATGKFVMPGLWDMHVHFRGGDTLIEENKNLLPLFLAYGITSVRDAGGDITPAVLQWREEINEGNLAGPAIYTSGPKLDGTRPAWPGSVKVTREQEIEAALDSLESLGVDYVKMYDGNLTEEAFYDIIKAAERRGLKTTGHMPMSANFLTSIDHGLDGVEHMYYPLKACSPVADSLTRLNLGYGMVETLIDTYDPELAQSVFEKMSAENVYVTPTLYIGKTLAEILEKDHSNDTLLAYIGEGVQQTYRGRIEGAKRARASGSQMREKMEEISARMIKPMFDAGVPILAGSDCGAFNSYVYPGESLHGELRSLVNAGLTPQQALQTSVINGPRFFDLEDRYGSIAAGKMADILILNEDPLENIESLASIFSVIKSGAVYHKNDLNRLLEQLRSK